MRYSNCSLRLLINIIMRVVLSKTFLKAFSMKFVKILKIWCALPKHRSHQHTLTSQVIITVSSPVSYTPPPLPNFLALVLLCVFTFFVNFVGIFCESKKIMKKFYGLFLFLGIISLLFFLFYFLDLSFSNCDKFLYNLIIKIKKKYEIV